MKIVGIKTNDIISVNNKAEFRIDKNNTKVVKLMADTLYKDKIQSVFREIISNSIDAQLLTKSKNPLELTFRFYEKEVYIDFRDYGPGIDPDKIVEIYCTFFNSSKSDTNRQIGGYGLGCKSPISLTNSYDVINYYNGKEYHYNIHLNHDNEMLIEKKNAIDTIEDNGIKVSIKFFNRSDVESNGTNIYSYIENYFKELICCSPIPIKLKLVANDNENKTVEGIISNNKVKLTNKIMFVDYRKYYDILSNFNVANYYNNSYTMEDIGKFCIKEKGEFIVKDVIYDIKILNGFIPYNVTNLIPDSDNKEKYICIESNILSLNLNKSNNSYKTVCYGYIEEEKLNVEPITSFGSLYIMSNIGDLTLTTSREDIIDNTENRRHITKLLEDIESLDVEVKDKYTNTFERVNKDDIEESMKGIFEKNGKEIDLAYNIFKTKDNKFVYYLNNRKMFNSLQIENETRDNACSRKVLSKKDDPEHKIVVLILNEATKHIKDGIKKNIITAYKELDLNLLTDDTKNKNLYYRFNFDSLKDIIDINEKDYVNAKNILYSRDVGACSNKYLDSMIRIIRESERIKIDFKDLNYHNEYDDTVKVINTNDTTSKDLLKIMFG